VAGVIESTESVDQGRFRAFFEQSMDGVLFTRPDGTVLEANPAACEILRMTEAEICARGRARLADPSDEGWAAAVAERERTGRFRGDLRMLRGDGSTVTVEVTSRVFSGPDGKPHTCVVFRDITERLRLTEQLREADAAARAAATRLEELLAHASDPIFVADLDGRYTEVNEAACRMLGFSREELLGKTIVDLIPDVDRERLRRTREELLAGGTRVDEWTLVRKDGAAVPVEVSAKILPDGRWQAIVRDISERKRVEEERDRASRRVAEILEAAPDAVVVCGADGRIVLVNEQTWRLFGYEPEALLGRSVEELIPERLRRLHLDHRAAYSAAPQTRPMGGGRQLAGRRKDGLEFPVDITLATITSDGGPLVLAFVRDVTERERQERAEREFIANAAHELRTPLAGIVGAVEVLQAGAADLPEQRKRFLDGIAGEAAWLTALVRALLLLARVEGRPETIVLERVELLPLLAEAAHQLDTAADVDAVVECPSGLAVHGNRALLEAAVRNLAQNASRHTRRGQITFSGTKSADGTVTIEVRDTGRGIPAEVQDRVFERFYRSSTDREGFGLGLPLVREIVQALGGKVEIESELGSGTAVRLHLEEMV
jgi:PAS domain S-box-containing protein